MFFLPHRGPVDEHDMAADAQSGGRGCAFDRILECATIRHQSGGSYDTVAMGFNDGAIDSLSKSEIIRIDDQTPHATV